MISIESSGKILASTLEWMDSPSSRARGLLKYSKAPEKFAAIFLLPLGGFFPLIHTIGMKFSIDIAFCDAEKKILSLVRNVSPLRLACAWKYFFGGCRYVVEFSKCDLAELREGDRLKWERS